MTINLNSADNKVKSITLNLSAIEFMIFHEAIGRYAEERENKLDREVAKRMLNVISELKGENKWNLQNW